MSTARLVGAIVPCLHMQLSKSQLNPTPVVCAVGQAGGLFVAGSGLESGRTLVYGAAGGRLAFELDLFRRFTKRLGTDFLLTGRLGADFLGVINRPVVHFLGQTLWTAPPYSMALGGGLWPRSEPPSLNKFAGIRKQRGLTLQRLGVQDEDDRGNLNKVGVALPYVVRRRVVLQGAVEHLKGHVTAWALGSNAERHGEQSE